MVLVRAHLSLPYTALCLPLTLTPKETGSSKTEETGDMGRDLHCPSQQRPKSEVEETDSMLTLPNASLGATIQPVRQRGRTE